MNNCVVRLRQCATCNVRLSELDVKVVALCLWKYDDMNHKVKQKQKYLQNN
jgi:hypothetical protein